MHYRTNCTIAFQVKALVNIVVMALVCLWPRTSAAQDALPSQWLYSPISQVQSVAYSPDGTLLAVGGAGGIQILNAATGTWLRNIPTACYVVYSVAFSPNGKTLADGGEGSSVGVVEFWNAYNSDRLPSPVVSDPVHSVVFSPDGQVLFAGTGANLEAFNTADYDLLSDYDQDTEGGVNSVAVSHSGSLLAYGTGIGAIVVASNPYYNVTVPAPTSLSPNSEKEGGASFTLTVNGTHFISGATVNWNGTALTTKFVSASKLTASVPAANIASPGTAGITATNPDGTITSALTFTINNAKYPKPVLSSISPNSATHGTGPITITLNGSGFLSDSVVRWVAGGTTTLLAMTYVSSTQLTATVPSALLANAGTATESVFNPAPGGGTSTGKTFTIK